MSQIDPNKSKYALTTNETASLKSTLEKRLVQPDIQRNLFLAEIYIK